MGHGFMVFGYLCPAFLIGALYLLAWRQRKTKKTTARPCRGRIYKITPSVCVYLTARISRGFAPGMNGGESNFSAGIPRRGRAVIYSHYFAFNS